MRRLFKTRFRKILFLCAVVATAAFALYPRRLPIPPDLITQRPGEPAFRWKFMRTVWTSDFDKGDGACRLYDVIDGGQRLYCVDQNDLISINKQDGGIIWRGPLRSKSEQNPQFQTSDSWSVTAGEEAMYVGNFFSRPSRRYRGFPYTPDPPTLIAFDKVSGRRLWKKQFDLPLVSNVCPTARHVLMATDDGDVVALDRKSGTVAWQRRICATDRVALRQKQRKQYPNLQNFNPYPGSPIIIHAADDTAVAQIGSSRLVALDLEDGRVLWSTPVSGREARQAEEGASCGVVIKAGVLYAARGSSERSVVALDARIGRKIWGRKSTGYEQMPSPIWVMDHRLISNVGGRWVSLRLDDGKTEWVSRFDGMYASGMIGFPDDHDSKTESQRLHEGKGPFKSPLLTDVQSDPLIGRRQRSLISMPTLASIASFNPATGKEEWRWQPQNGLSFTKTVSDGDKLYLMAGSKVVAIEPGAPEPLPATERGRRDLAARMVNALFRSDEDHESWIDKLWNWLPPFLGGNRGRVKINEPDTYAATMALLRLGKDGIPTLMGYVKETVRKNERQTPAQIAHIQSQGEPDNLNRALDILCDLGDRSIIPDLNSLLTHSTNKLSRKDIAITLIRFADTRSSRPLFSFATLAVDDSDVRQDALYLLCRGPWRGPRASGPTPSELLAYLESLYRDSAAPEPLRKFAVLEQMNLSGDYSRNIDLVTSGPRTARIMPEPRSFAMTLSENESGDAFGFAGNVHPEAKFVDERGVHWGAFYSNYLGGNYHLWIARSRDGKEWTNPAFVLDLGRKCDSPDSGIPSKVKMRCHGGVLVLNWTETGWNPSRKEETKNRHTDSISLAQVYRDSDGDGLTDLVECQIGTDPINPDTNHNGIPDGIDKIPLYVPHKMSDEEGIYQAIMEAICFYGQPWLKPAPSPSAAADSIATSTHPLILPIGGSSKPFELLGRPGPILFRRIRNDSDSRRIYGAMNSQNTSFSSPTIGWDGVFKQHTYSDLNDQDIPEDPFTPSSSKITKENPWRLQDFLSFVRSTDGLRARVSYQVSYSSISLNCDVEVRKLRGRWVPVECRTISKSGQNGTIEAHGPMNIP